MDLVGHVRHASSSSRFALARLLLPYRNDARTRPCVFREVFRHIPRRFTTLAKLELGEAKFPAGCKGAMPNRSGFITFVDQRMKMRKPRFMWLLH